MPESEEPPSQPHTERLAAPSSDAVARAAALSTGFALVAALTYGLIVIGALVRANGAGLACPDWPLCFGDVIPELDIKVGFEWGHRAIAGSLSIAFVGLSAVCLATPSIRPRLLAGILGTGAVLALQILLGAFTVWELLASWTVTSHLLAGNAFAICLAFLALRLRDVAHPEAAAARLPASARARLAIGVCAGLLVLQMVLGGLVSSTYAGLACPDWPTCADGAFFPGFEGARGLHLLHRLTAYALLVAAAVAVVVTRQDRGVARYAQAALALVLLQVGVGVANVLLRIPVEVTGLHSALAAGLCLTLALSLRAAWERPHGARVDLADGRSGAVAGAPAPQPAPVES